MTDRLCGYIDRDETIVAYLYDDLDAGPRRDFDAHLLTCGVCRGEVAGLRGVRTQLAGWAPPEPLGLTGLSGTGPGAAIAGSERGPWWRTIPAWAQVAAALLCLGVAGGLANLDVRYDRNGLVVRTGWSNRSGGPGGSGATDTAQAASPAKEAPWQSDLAALERQLKTEFQASAVSAPAAAARASGTPDAETLRRVRTLLEESEKRQQRELALRVAELVRDVNRQRQADLVKIDRNMDVMQNRLGVEVLQQRQSLNYFMRVNQRQ